MIFGLEGDDVIDPGNDAVTDYVSCGPGFDVVNQMPGPLPDNQQQGFLQYNPQPPVGEDAISDDCEERAL